MDKENKDKMVKRSKRTVVTDGQEATQEIVIQEKHKTSTRKTKIKRQTYVYISEDEETDTNQNNNEKLNEIILHESHSNVLDTPRRSTRKSIRPIQDYKDIVLRSTTKKKTQQDDKQLSEVEGTQVRWTPSSVGRTSEKRRRKSKRATSARKRFNTIDLTDRDSDNPNEGDEVSEVFEEQTPITKQKKTASKKSKTAEVMNAKIKSVIDITDTPPISNSKSSNSDENVIDESNKSPKVMVGKSITRKSNVVLEEQTSLTKQKKRASKKPKAAEEETLNAKRKSVIDITNTPTNSGTKSSDSNENIIDESNKSPEVMVRKSASRKSKASAQERKSTIEVDDTPTSNSNAHENNSIVQNEKAKSNNERKSTIEVDDTPTSISNTYQHNTIVHNDSLKEENKKQSEICVSGKSEDTEEEKQHSERISKELELEEDPLSLELDSDEDEDTKNQVSVSSIHKVEPKVTSLWPSTSDKTIDVETEDLVDVKKVEVFSPSLNEDESNSNTNSNFGNYLSAQKINLSDLGLAPLEQEMPSLVVMEESNDVPQLNETFEASDPLKMEDGLEEEEKPVIILPKIEIEEVSTDTAGAKEKPKKSVRIHPEQLGGETPKRQSKVSRFPTPHKNKIDLIQQSATAELATIKVEYNENDEESNNENEIQSQVESRLSTSLPLENPIEAETPRISVRRTRTFSLSEVKAKRNVYFHSPANQTTLIEDLDLALLEKHKKSLQKPKNDVNVKRRSKSLEDLSRHAKTSSNQKQPSSLKKDKDSSKFRTKLPNFAAMHERNFSKMENIEDFLQRKADRAKMLLNSASKLAPTSSAKKVEEKLATKRDVAGKPKAVKKIDLASANNNLNTNNNNNVEEPVKRIPRPIKKPKVPTLENLLPEDPIKLETLKYPTNHAKNLPKPMDVMKKAMNLSVSEKVMESFPPKIGNTRKPEKTILKAVNNCSRPAFNLSTALPSTSKLNLTSTTTSMNILSASKGLNHTVDLGSANKNTSRLQRHMEMFKSRSGRKAGGNLNDTAQRIDLIKGVRSNRRFELQMQHRRNLES